MLTSLTQCHWNVWITLLIFSQSSSSANSIEIIWFGTITSLCHLQSLDLGLHVGADITPVDVIHDLGILLDSKLTMKKHMSIIMSICFYHLQHLKQVRCLLGPDITAVMVSAFVLRRLDYCNSFLAGLPQSTIIPLQRVQMQQQG